MKDFEENRKLTVNIAPLVKCLLHNGGDLSSDSFLVSFCGCGKNTMIRSVIGKGVIQVHNFRLSPFLILS